MCIFHEGLRHLSEWWPQNEREGVGQRDLALSLVVLPAKEKGHPFLDWFAAAGPDELWQVRALRRIALACQGGLVDAIRDLPDERWEWGLGEVLSALEAQAPKATQRTPLPTIFHEMMVLPGLTNDEVLQVGVLQGVRPRTTCLQWYVENRGSSGSGWPIPLLERLAERVFSRQLLERIDSCTDASQALKLLRDLPSPESSASSEPRRRNCCDG